MKATHVRYGVVGFALSLAILAYMQRVAISLAAVPMAVDLQLDKQQVGAILGAFGLAYALFEIPMGLFGDKRGAHRVLTQIVLLWSAFTALTGAAWNFTSMWIMRFLFGAGEAGAFPNITRMLSEWLPARERARAQSMLWAATRWGAAATPPLVLVGINLFGWRWSFVALALMGAIWVGFFVWRFVDNPADHPKINQAELDLLQEAQTLVSRKKGESWKKILIRPQVVLLSLQYFCWAYVWYFFVTWMPTYLEEAHGQTLAASALLSILPLLMGGFGCLVSSSLLRRWNRRYVAVTCFAVVVVLLILLTRAPSVGLAIALMAAVSFSGDVTVPISWDSCTEIGRSYTATVAGAMNMLANFSGFAAPWVAGIILQRNGNDWNEVLYLMAGVAAVGAVLWLFIDPHARPETAAETTAAIPADS